MSILLNSINPFYSFQMSGMYIILSLTGLYYNKNFKIKNIKLYMGIYNIMQILLCSYMVYGLSEFFEYKNIFGIGIPYNKNIEYFIYIHYLSKYLDWFDTLWMIYNNKSEKQMTFLHLYHHSTINLIWGYLLYIGHGNGLVYFGTFINSFVHIVMYSHYLITSLGYKNPIKKYITFTQLSQFMLCFIQSCLVLFYYKDTSNYPVNLAWIQFIYQITMLYLFMFKIDWQPFI